MTMELHKRATLRATFCRQSGFTLIEGMIAAAILTTGLLALSGMQAISLSRNMDANELTRATNLAADMMERIQFNRKNVTTYGGIDTSVACTISTTAQPMARGDCDQWDNLLASTYASGLAGVRGRVTVAATGPAGLNQSNVAVLVSWTEAAGANKVPRARQVTLTSVIAPE